MTADDYYQLLGVTPKATAKEIKTAYRSLALRYHPDLGQSEEHDLKFRQITEAYQTLSDPDKRNVYNKELDLEHYVPLEDDFFEDDNFQEAEKVEVSLESQVGGGGESWDRIRARQGEHDLPVDQKLALDAESADFDESAQEDDFVVPWGEGDEEGGGEGGFSFLGLLGLKGRKGRKTISKQELKQRLDEASQPLQPVNVMPAQEAEPPPPEVEEEPKQEFFGDALREERMFFLQISPLECAVGTTREVAFPGRDDGEPRRIKVNIPVGIKDNAVLQIAQGWDRAKVRITVTTDPYVILYECNIIYILPISFGEAINGFSWEVPTVSGTRKVTIGRRQSATNTICLDGCGIPDSQTGIKGDFFVQPFLVPPKNMTDTLRAVVDLVDQRYTRPVREDLQRNGVNSRCFSRRGGDIVCRLPVTLGEALSGIQVSVPTSNGSVSVDVDNDWGEENRIILKGRGSGKRSDGMPSDLIVWPYVAMPDVIDEDVKSAAEAIEMHYQSDIRAGLPRKLLNG